MAVHGTFTESYRPGMTVLCGVLHTETSQSRLRQRARCSWRNDRCDKV